MPHRPPRKRPATPPQRGFTPEQVNAAVAARDRAAAGNPRVVRRAFLGGQPIQLGELAIQPLTIGTFWLLEETQNPLAGDSGTAAATISFRHLAEAAFILTEPQRADEVLQQGKDHFRREAFALSCKIPLADLDALTAALVGRLSEAEETMPPEDAAAGTNPSVPPGRRQDSAGG